MLWKADEPQSDEWLLIAKRDLPDDLWETRLDLWTTAVLCPNCGRFWIAQADGAAPVEYVPARPALSEHLMRSLLYAALFFETSGEEECDLDLAVKQLENIAAELEKLTPSEQEELRRFAHEEAERDPSPELSDEIRTLVDALLQRD